MDFQTAPYEKLCGCVAIITNRTTMQPNSIRKLIANNEGNRNVCVNCPDCKGTGILPVDPWVCNFCAQIFDSEVDLEAHKFNSACEDKGGG